MLRINVVIGTETVLTICNRSSRCWPIVAVHRRICRDGVLRSHNYPNVAGCDWPVDRLGDHISATDRSGGHSAYGMGTVTVSQHESVLPGFAQSAACAG